MIRIKLGKKTVALILSGVIALMSGTYVVVRQVEYKKIIHNVDSDLENVNDDFFELVEKTGFEEITLTSSGNSIASGYSMKDEIIPLLLRNTDLLNKAKKNNIKVNYYQFARPQDNNDEHVYNWLINNTKQSQVNDEIRYDYLGDGTGVDASNITVEDVNKYYPTDVVEDKGLDDIISLTDDKNMNIIVYNGGTGAFLDSLTRGSEDFFSSINRDLSSVEAFCKYIYLKNPKVQIYICGIPNFFNLGITEIVNSKYRELTRFYPNLTYVESSPEKVLYDSKDGTKIDIHYNKEEYLCLNKNIMEAIYSNYISNSICTILDLAMKKLSYEIQFSSRYLRGNPKVIQNVIDNVLVDYIDSDIDRSDIIKGINKFIELYKVRYGYDYYYTSKNITIDILKNYLKSIEAQKNYIK